MCNYSLLSKFAYKFSEQNYFQQSHRLINSVMCLSFFLISASWQYVLQKKYVSFKALDDN